MRRRLLLVCAGLLLLARPVHAALTLDEVLAKHFEARGGLPAIRAIQSIRDSGSARFGDSLTAEYSDVVSRKGFVRNETTLQGLTSVQAYDGKEGWFMSPFGGRRDPERLSTEDVKGLAQTSDIDGPLVDWKQKGHQVEYLGTEDVDGAPAHKLRVALKDGDIQTVYLDADSFLTIRVVQRSFVRGAESEGETDYGNYAKVGGVWLPFSYESGAKNAPKTARTTLAHVELNVAVDEAQFHFPAKGQAVTRVILAASDAAGPPAVEAPAPRGEQPAPALDAGVLSGLRMRNIGSAAMSGRISAVAARVEKGRTTLFVGAASGGVWKSLDGGTTFKPVFDLEKVQSIGAIAIDPTNPKTVWVGSGEAWTRNSTSIGDGIYKSTDGGETWTNMGLPESERIVRVLVHPKNGDVVYACVPGKLWSDSADRGLYKTSDGGKSWTQVLKGANLSTGCSSVAMDPRNPEVLYAGMWDFRRKGWTFRSGGDAPESPSASGLFTSSDGGKSWRQLPAGQKGLPAGPWGRLELAFAPSDGKILYAFIESKDSGLYRSADGGQTWEARDKSQFMVWRPFYFSRLVVDPTNPERLFKPDLTLVVSTDGGHSFSYSGGGSHGDWHDLWIDPTNPEHVIGGDDGGLWISHDGGNRWWKGNNLPVSQFYHVTVDDQDPFNVYGGLQDNSSWIGATEYPGGITNQRWENVYGGDGFCTFVDPADPDYVYAEAQGGTIGRVNRRTHVTRTIQPEANFKEKLRWNWNSPIAFSPTKKGVIYIGAQFLFRTKDHGDTWERISPDLTTNDPEKQKQEESGGVTVDNSAAEMHTTIVAIDESPLDARTVWAGTDDGNLQLTRDAGKTWTNVAPNVPGLPAHAWVTSVVAGHHDAGTAYATFDLHTFGDMTPFVYRTADFGKSWTRMAAPESGVRGYAHVVREDPVKKTLLFLGTELGLWVSIDGGASWAAFKGGTFPSVAVRDLAIQARTGALVVATHGRGIWILDDLTPLRALDTAVLAQRAVFLPIAAAQQRMPSNGGWAEGDAAFYGENPPSGVNITFYQRARHVFGPITLEIFDAQGKLMDTINPPKRRGLSQVTWGMRLKPPHVPRAAQLAGAANQGPRVLPGVYTVRLTKGGERVETKVKVDLDRRAPFTLADRKVQLDATQRAAAVFEDMTALVQRIDAADAGARAAAAKIDTSDALGKKLADLDAHLQAVKKEIVATKEGGAITGEERIREHLDQLYGALNGWEGRPGKYQLDRIDALKRELAEVASRFGELATKDVPTINQELQQRKLPEIKVTAENDAEDEPDTGVASEEAWRCVESRGQKCADVGVARERD